jgi:hypothetical protein
VGAWHLNKRRQQQEGERRRGRLAPAYGSKDARRERAAKGR